LHPAERHNRDPKDRRLANRLKAFGLAVVIVAVVRADPSKATGLDGSVKTLGQAPYGTVLIMCAAAGFAAYGCYSFALSRYARM
jgi:hypothetical protein